MHPISKLINLDEEIISHRLMGYFNPSKKSYELLIAKKINPKELTYKPFPFLLANTFEEKILNYQILAFSRFYQ